MTATYHWRTGAVTYGHVAMPFPVVCVPRYRSDVHESDDEVLRRAVTEANGEHVPDPHIEVVTFRLAGRDGGGGLVYEEEGEE